MKRQKPITAVILSFVLIVSAILGQFPANTRVKAETEGYGISNPRIDSNGVTTWDCIWFGNYWQSNETEKEPIKWRVLSVDGDDAFLLADQNLDCQRYNKELESVTWETCTLRAWLNNDFYRDAFSEEEQEAVRTTAVVNNEDNPVYGIKGGDNTQDKVYLLSIAEVGNVAYGFSSKLNEGSKIRYAKNTGYAKKQGAYTDTIASRAGNGWWWLRSPGYNSSNAAYVNTNGYGDDYGIYVNYGSCAVRPALHINLSSTVWEKAGKVNSLGGIIEAETPTSLSPETAKPTQSSTPIKYGISNPVIKYGVTTWDCIWFGNYWQSDGETKEPIKWRVLSVDGDDAFLLADKNLDCQRYQTEYRNVTWETCTLRTWLNSTFYQNAFSGAEQAVVRTTAVVNEENPKYGTEGGNNTQDKVYLLSIAEASNVAYGFSSMLNEESTRCARNTEYAKKQGATIYAGNGHWWLRSPGNGNYGFYAALVSGSGSVNSFGNSVSSYYGVRPALHINLSSTVWKKAGKVNSLGDVIESETPISPSPETAKPTPTIRQTSAPTSTSSAIPEDLPTRYGISNPVIKDGGTTWDCIWFGNYWQSDGETKEPIKWRVLSVDGDDAFLLADKNLDCQPYNIEYKSVTWETCTLRTWLNSTFYQNAFSEAEQAAVHTTAVVNQDNSYYGTKGRNNTQDKVYLLSIAEASNAAYGFDSMFERASETGYAKNTEYAKKQGAFTNTSDSYAGNGKWWLRSPGYNSKYAAYVSLIGWGINYGELAYYRSHAVRPALHINLSSTVWKKAGKVNSLGNIIETETPISPSPETAKPTPQQTAKPTQIPTVTPTLQKTAKPTQSSTSTKYGISNPVIKYGVTTWDCIWFGNYWQSDEKTKEPIKWRVLSIDGDDAFLLADKSLDCQPYNTEYKSITWENCTLRTWLNSTFYQNAFSGAERAAVRTTAVVNKDNPFYGVEGGNDTQDKVYLLSIDEASNAAYGFDSMFERISETRYAKNTEHAEKQDAYTTLVDKYVGNGCWWLRSPGYLDSVAVCVNYDGLGDLYGGDVSLDINAVRPTLHINLSSSVWKKAGKVNSLGDIIEAETPTSPSPETAKPTPQQTARPTQIPTVTAAPVPEASPTKYGISNPRIDSNGATTWDCIWFGNYWQSNEKEKEPIKWRVLSVDGDDAFLLADQNLDYKSYNGELKNVTWETCTLRTWLNNDFYRNVFSGEEQSAIRTTTVVNEDNSGVEGGNNTQDKVYLLSIAEASNAAYGFNSNFANESGTRYSKNTIYAERKCAFAYDPGSSGGSVDWWLRSPGYDSLRAALVKDNGSGFNLGDNVDSIENAVRPALHIDLSSSAWRKAGIVSMSGDSTGGMVVSPTPVPTKTPAPIQTGSDYDISNPHRDSSGVTTWDCIWFGNYWQNNETAKEPIKWRVLSVDGDDAFLLADQNLDCQPYNKEVKSVTWETCTLRTWLNNDFYRNAFSEEERSAVRTTTVLNGDNFNFGIEAGNNTQDNVYLLSMAEVTNAAYGFNINFIKESETRYSKNTRYAKMKGAYTSTDGNGSWWLRSPGYDSSFAACVARSGRGGRTSSNVGDAYNAVRPALHINLSSNTWSKAGTVSSASGSTSTTGQAPDDVKQAEPTPKGEGANDQSQAVMSDSTQGSVSAGIKIKDTAGVTYTVTSSGSSKSEAAYTAPKNKKVTSVAIPATVNLNGTTYKVTSIKANAFKKCKKLKKVTIGKNIKTIGKNAFYQCTKLKSITIKTTRLANKTIGSKAFAKLNKKVKIKVPKKKLSAYKKLLKKKGVTGKKQVIKK